MAQVDKKLRRISFRAGEGLYQRVMDIAARLDLEPVAVCREALELYLLIAEAGGDLRGLDLQVFVRDVKTAAASMRPLPMGPLASLASLPAPGGTDHRPSPPGSPLARPRFHETAKNGSRHPKSPKL